MLIFGCHDTIVCFHYKSFAYFNRFRELYFGQCWCSLCHFCFNTTSFTKMYWVYRVSLVEKIFRKYRRHILWKSYICLDMVWWSLHIIVFCRKLNSFKMIASENHNFIMMMHNIFLERVQFLRNDYSVVISMNAYWINKVFTDVSCYNDSVGWIPCKMPFQT